MHNILFVRGSAHFYGRKPSRFFSFLPLLSLLFLLLSFPVNNSLQTGQRPPSAVRESMEAGFALWKMGPRGDTIVHPEVVRPERDGTLRLRAEIGRAIGPEIKYMPEWKAYGWFTSDDLVEWDVEVSKKGEYEVYLEWSVSDEEAGKPFIFEASDQQLKGKVDRTGSWEKYKLLKIGSMQLSLGRQKMVFKPASDFEKGGALLDLREVKLILVK